MPVNTNLAGIPWRRYLDAFSDSASKAIRGYTAAEKAEAQWNPDRPIDAPPAGPSPEAERYAGQYLAGRSGRPRAGAEVFNQLALADLFKSAGEKVKTKYAGSRGFLAGQEQAKLDAEKEQP